MAEITAEAVAHAVALRRAMLAIVRVNAASGAPRRLSDVYAEVRREASKAFDASPSDRAALDAYQALRRTLTGDDEGPELEVYALDDDEAA